MMGPYGINLFLFIAYLWHIGELHLRFDNRHFDKDFIYSFGMYSLFMLMSSGMILVMTRIDTIMVLGMCGKYKAGIYRTVAFITLLLEVPIKVTK